MHHSNDINTFAVDMVHDTIITFYDFTDIIIPQITNNPSGKGER